MIDKQYLQQLLQDHIVKNWYSQKSNPDIIGSIVYTLCFMLHCLFYWEMVWVIHGELTKVTVVFLEKVNTNLFLIKENQDRPCKKCGKLIHPPPLSTVLLQKNFSLSFCSSRNTRIQLHNTPAWWWAQNIGARVALLPSHWRIIICTW